MNKAIIKTDIKWSDAPVGFPKHPIVEGQALKRISRPARHQAVYLYDAEAECLRPVIIVGGEYMRNGRIRNKWAWLPIQEDLTLGEKTKGYGDFYEIPDSHQLHVKVHIDYTITRGEKPTV